MGCNTRRDNRCIIRCKHGKKIGAILCSTLGTNLNIKKDIKWDATLGANMDVKKDVKHDGTLGANLDEKNM